MVSLTAGTLAPRDLATDVASNAMDIRHRASTNDIDRSMFEVRRSIGEASDVMDQPTFAVALKILDARSQLERRFKRLVSQWKEDRNELSSNHMEWAMSENYQKIIAIGPEAIPLVLRELRHAPDHWFWALSTLTDADPVKSEHRGIFPEMVKDWLSWGTANGFIFSEDQKIASRAKRFKSPKN
jgi:hypothetical protein